MLLNKSLSQLRAIAQSFGISDIFAKPANILAQEIEASQVKLVTIQEKPLPRPEYDGRLRTKPVSRMSNQKDIEEALKGHVERGLHLTFPEPEQWHMQHGIVEDCGNCRQPLKNIIDAADRVLSGR
jgi:bacterioferritin-associated ferredoxin